MDALELSTPTQFGLNASPIQQNWVESSALKCIRWAQSTTFRWLRQHCLKDTLPRGSHLARRPSSHYDQGRAMDLPGGCANLIGPPQKGHLRGTVESASLEPQGRIYGPKMGPKSPSSIPIRRRTSEIPQKTNPRGYGTAFLFRGPNFQVLILVLIKYCRLFNSTQLFTA